MIVFCISIHMHCMSVHLLVCPSIILSVCPSFCPPVYPSIHSYVCSHIVKIAKSIAKSSKINLKSMVQFHGNKSSMKWKKYWKENCIEKPHRCSYELVFLILCNKCKGFQKKETGNMELNLLFLIDYGPKTNSLNAGKNSSWDQIFHSLYREFHYMRIR